MYGRVLLARSSTAFDELRQGVRDIEFLADPGAGEVRIECQESIAAAILPAVIHRFSQTYPRVVLHVEHLGSLTAESRALQERTIDVAIYRFAKPDIEKRDDLNVELLFNDELVAVAGAKSRWVGRRKIDISELAEEPWILTRSDTWNYVRIAEAFAARGLQPPKIMTTTLSTHLRANLVSLGPYITTFPKSVLRVYAERFSLHALPVKLPPRPWPVVAVTLKNRTLSPVVERFIEEVKEFTLPLRLADKAGPAH